MLQSSYVRRTGVLNLGVESVAGVQIRLPEAGDLANGRLQRSASNLEWAAPNVVAAHKNIDEVVCGTLWNSQFPAGLG